MPLTPQEACLESKCERIARIITREYGVTVRIEGGLAYFDAANKAIVLPNLTDEAMKFLQGFLDGVLDHECCHPIFSDTDLLVKTKPEPVLKHVWNSIEDFWVEREMGKLYIGCAQNLAHLRDIMFTDMDNTWGEVGAFSKLLGTMQAVWFGKDTTRAFKDPEIGALLKSLEPEIKAGFDVRSTQEALDLARRILAKIKDLAEEAEKQSKSGEGDLSEEEMEAGAQAGKILEMIEGAGDDLKGSPMEVEEYFNAKVMTIPDTSSRHDPEEYKIFTTEFDYETTYSGSERLAAAMTYSNLKVEVSDYVGNMAQMLSLSLAAVTQARWVGGARKGRRWDKRRMAQWFLDGEDDRIWKQQEAAMDWDTAVTCLWDCSGSMGSNHSKESRSHLARLASVAFHEALCRANIPHEVLGFNTGGRVSAAMRARVEDARQRGTDFEPFSRVEDTDNRMVFVPFGSMDGRALVHIDGDHSNRDGEAVLWAAKRLARRTEKRKVLIVGSDGQPYGARYHYTEKKYLQSVIRKVILAGFEVYGLGVISDAVKDFYPSWEVIDDVKDLPRAVIQLLGRSLFAQQGTGNAKFPDFCERPD